MALVDLGEEGKAPRDADATAPMERSGASLHRGEQVGRHVVLHPLGEGGMGIVYAAYDPQLDRRIALKVVRSEHRSERGRSIARARLAREAQALAKLSHRNVVTVYDVGAHGEDLFVAMELVDGQTLREWLTTPRPWPEIVARMLDAGRGLAAAHEVGVVHRDFKPSNVLVSSRGDLRVTDFGLARLEATTEVVSVAELEASTRIEHDAELTRTGKIVGTPAYMAPEQHAGHPPDARADQYAFALTLYEALYGTRPFGALGGEALAAAKRLGVRTIPASDTTSHRVPRAIRSVLARGLAADPRHRFASMDRLLAALARGSRPRSRWAPALLLAGVGVFAVGLQRVHADVDERCTGADDKVLALPGVHGCSGDTASIAEPTPHDGATAAEARTLRQRIDRVRVRAAASQYGHAVPEAQTVVDEARALGSPALLAEALLAQAEVHDDLGDADAAIEALRDAAVAARSSGHAHAELEALVELGAVLAVRRQEPSRAAFYLDRAQAVLEAVGEDPELEARLALARGRVAFVMGRDEDARVDLELARDLASQNLGPDHPSVATAQSQLAGVLLRRGDMHGAEVVLEDVLATYERVFGPHHPRVASTLGNLGLVQAGSGRFDDAIEQMTRARAIFETTFGATHPAVATADDSLGDVLRRAGRCDEAIPRFERAIATFEQVGLAGSQLGGALLGLGRCKLARDGNSEALAVLERAWEHARADDISPVQRGDTALALALARIATGDRDGAEPLLHRAEADFTLALDPADDRWTELTAARR